MQAACKQSQKGLLPVLNGPIPFNQAVAQCTESRKAIAALVEGSKSSFLPSELRTSPDHSWAVFIGPEGDFTPAEVDEAQRAGFDLVHLGPHRLRTETAGLYAVAAFAQRSENV